MKQGIHPAYNTEVKVTCACGNSFVTGSTEDEIKVELCSQCHPFYTGKQKLVDTARRVEKFQDKMKAKEKASGVSKGKKVKREKRAEQKAKKEVTVKSKTIKPQGKQTKKKTTKK